MWNLYLYILYVNVSNTENNVYFITSPTVTKLYVILSNRGTNILWSSRHISRETFAWSLLVFWLIHVTDFMLCSTIQIQPGFIICWYFLLIQTCVLDFSFLILEKCFLYVFRLFLNRFESTVIKISISKFLFRIEQKDIYFLTQYNNDSRGVKKFN